MTPIETAPAMFIEERLASDAREHAIATGNMVGTYRINPTDFQNMVQRLGVRVTYRDGASRPPGPAMLMLNTGAHTLTVYSDESVAPGALFRDPGDATQPESMRMRPPPGLESGAALCEGPFGCVACSGPPSPASEHRARTVEALLTAIDHCADPAHVERLAHAVSLLAGAPL